MKTDSTNTIGLRIITIAMLLVALTSALAVFLPAQQTAWGLGSKITVVDAKDNKIENVTVDFAKETKTVTITTMKDIPCVEVNIKDIDGHRIGYSTVDDEVIKANAPLSVKLEMNKKPAKVVLVSSEAAEEKPPAKIVGGAVIAIGAVMAFVSYRKLQSRKGGKGKGGSLFMR